MEQVALSRVVNDEIRRLVDRFELRPEEEGVSWYCGCGCFTLIDASLAEYDASGGRLLAPGHPVDESRAAATAAFERQFDTSAALEHLDEELRRKLTEDLARRLERQELARRLERLIKKTRES
jgi:hypothetical protein